MEALSLDDQIGGYVLALRMLGTPMPAGARLVPQRALSPSDYPASALERYLNPLERSLLPTVMTLDVHVQQDAHAVPRPLCDLRWIYATVEPRRNSGMP
jgi:hypothetical protein